MSRKTFLYISFSFAIAILAITNKTSATSHSSDYNSSVYTPEMNFQASLNNLGKVDMSWDSYVPSGFNYYKVIRSTSNSDPVYPDDGYIRAISNSQEINYTDTSPPTGTVYYRVCAIAQPNRYCSNVVVLSISSSTCNKYDNCPGTVTPTATISSYNSGDNEPYPNSEQWHERCYSWNGTIDSKNNCVWPGGLWCDRWALYDGDCLDIFTRYGDPRTLSNATAKSRASNPVKTDDISDSAYTTAINYLKDTGIVHGYDDGTFRPDNTITRAEFTKIIIEAVYPQEASGMYCFDDINNEWFAPYVCFAKEKKLISGFDDNTFRPHQTITIAEAAKIVLKAFGIPGQEGTSAEWYSGYIQALSDHNFIPITISHPFQRITRGEMAELIWRIKENINNKSSWDYNK